jgi:hypothetical protein
MMVNLIEKPGCLRWSALPMTLFGLLQLGAGLATLQTPPEAANTVPLGLLGTVALLWAALVGILAVGLLRARPLAAVASAWTLLAFALYQTARHLLFTQADYEGARWPFLLTVNLLLAGVALVVLGGHYTQRSNPNGD